MNRIPLLVIVGPTAVGKSAIALAVAERLGGEIVNADSRQIFRGMDIGTAKPSPDEQARVPHHLLDRCDPDEAFTLADYQVEAMTIIRAIAARGRLPILSGGTGLYVRSLLRGWTIPVAPPDLIRRESLRQEAAELGVPALHAQLAGVDPVAAGRIESLDLVRIMRALEVYEQTGRPISEQQQAVPPDFDLRAFGLTRGREILYERINGRVEAMMAAGLRAEARALWERYGPVPLQRTLGYAECLLEMQGELAESETVQRIQQQTRRYAKRQLTWFRGDAELAWLDLDGCATLAATVETIVSQVQGLSGIPSLTGPGRGGEGR
ncbi:MAG: tRNA (adenosine(37)-N6)-dimethylallyltransferase MiaA [Candidatus Sericytochromatia bacterium]|nr:tRNA (adenosine(37)-N6)-dimethylallyltransferase MiaA [Candidatus Sericytochromatia bacterium]